MIIVVSGTHGTGKSTYIDEFVAEHPGFTVLGDPFELVDDAAATPTAEVLFQQLRLSASRLLALAPGADVIAERGPLDFVAYLEALVELDRPTASELLFEQGLAIAATAMTRVDRMIVLPLSSASGFTIPDDEDLDLREAMDAALLDLVEDPDLVGDAEIVLR